MDTEKVWLAVLSLLGLIFGGIFAILKYREVNNVKALTKELAEQGERLTFMEAKGREDNRVIAALRRQNGLMKTEREEFIRLLKQYQKAGNESLIVVDEKGTVVDWDAAATLMFGYNAEEAIGHDVSGLIVPPEQRQHHRYMLSQTFLNRRTVRTAPIKAKAICKDGDYIDVEIQLLPGWETGGEEAGWRYGARIRKLILPSPGVVVVDKGIVDAMETPHDST